MDLVDFMSGDFKGIMHGRIRRTRYHSESNEDVTMEERRRRGEGIDASGAGE